jgi:hypothetical protein
MQTSGEALAVQSKKRWLFSQGFILNLKLNIIFNWIKKFK